MGLTTIGMFKKEEDQKSKKKNKKFQPVTDEALCLDMKKSFGFMNNTETSKLEQNNDASLQTPAGFTKKKNIFTHSKKNLDAIKGCEETEIKAELVTPDKPEKNKKKSDNSVAKIKANSIVKKVLGTGNKLMKKGTLVNLGSKRVKGSSGKLENSHEKFGLQKKRQSGRIQERNTKEELKKDLAKVKREENEEISSLDDRMVLEK